MFAIDARKRRDECAVLLLKVLGRHRKFKLERAFVCRPILPFAQSALCDLNWKASLNLVDIVIRGARASEARFRTFQRLRASRWCPKAGVGLDAGNSAGCFRSIVIGSAYRVWIEGSQWKATAKLAFWVGLSPGHERGVLDPSKQ